MELLLCCSSVCCLSRAFSFSPVTSTAETWSLFSLLLSLRSFFQMSAQRQRAGTGTWSTFAVSSARLFWAASVTSWKRAGRTAAPALSPCTPSTATPAGNTSVRAHLSVPTWNPLSHPRAASPLCSCRNCTVANAKRRLTCFLSIVKILNIKSLQADSLVWRSRSTFWQLVL